MEDVRLIKTKFKKHGEDFKLLARSQKVALFERSFVSLDSGERVYSFEVHKIRLRNPSYGKKITVERLSSDEEFGLWGWGYNNLNRAIEKFAQLTEAEGSQNLWDGSPDSIEKGINDLLIKSKKKMANRVIRPINNGQLSEEEWSERKKKERKNS